MIQILSLLTKNTTLAKEFLNVEEKEFPDLQFLDTATVYEKWFDIKRVTAEISEVLSINYGKLPARYLERRPARHCAKHYFE